ncbi:hypothetical protein ACP70R_049168 [Stipagrostis hirtigluma subsp. patula]
MQHQQPNDTAHTVHAAAVVLAAAARSTTGLLLHHQQQLQLDNHHHNCTATKKRWWSRLKAKLCFRRHGHPRRIADAVPASPEPAAAGEQTAASSSSYYARHVPQPALAFVAPPSSPASSVLTSEAASPVVLLNAISYNSSPTAPMFAVGPYAREPQQLVSPPAFSAGLTEPSTAPVTPPPESVCSLQLATTPSSPEVPFARFLSSSAAAEAGQHGGVEGGFQAYQLQPGSPILVSPGSTSSSPPAWLFGAEERRMHRVRVRNEGSLLDGRIPEAGSTGHGEEGGCARSENDEVCGKSGEFVFGNADADAAGEWFAGGDHGGGRAASASMGMRIGDASSTAEDGGKHKQWPFFIHHG